MSNQLNSYWEPIDYRFDFPPVYFDSDDKDRVDKNRRRNIIVDPKPQFSLMSSLLIVFVLVSGVFFATMSFAFLEVQTTVETLQLPQQHPVFSDLRRIENAATLVFVAIYAGFAVLAIWGALNLSRKKAETRRNVSTTGI